MSLRLPAASAAPRPLQDPRGAIPVGTARHAPSPLCFTRAAPCLPFVRFLDKIGAPTDRLLASARLTRELFEAPDNLVPIPLVYRFLELIAAREGGPAFALHVAQRTVAFEFGAFGAVLRRATTIGEYVALAIDAIDTATSGERFWLDHQGARACIRQHLPGPPGSGRKIADLYTLGLTINVLRLSLGKDWQPEAVELIADQNTAAAADHFLGDTHVETRAPHSSITFARSLLERPIVVTGAAVTSGTPVPAMPQGVRDSVHQAIRDLLPGGYPDIHFVAKLAGMSARTLQRRLAALGTDYSSCVMSCRMSLAGKWLIDSELKVTEIAARLGYSDTANFSRAFRQAMGISPRAFRAEAPATPESRPAP